MDRRGPGLGRETGPEIDPGLDRTSPWLYRTRVGLIQKNPELGNSKGIWTGHY